MRTLCLSSGNNAARTIGGEHVPHLLALYHEWHQLDTKHRHVNLRKAILNILKNITNLRKSLNILKNITNLLKSLNILKNITNLCKTLNITNFCPWLNILKSITHLHKSLNILKNKSTQHPQTHPQYL